MKQIYGMAFSAGTEQKSPGDPKDRKKLVCIGSSTGGPGALQTVLSRLPDGIMGPVVIVQHMPPGFTKSLAKRLDTLCDIHVKEAEDGDVLEDGTAYIAPGGHHLSFRSSGFGTRIRLVDSSPVNGHMPSVDVMFTSASQLRGFDIMAVIMTGMGSDGTAGLIEMKKQGHTRVIAQSEQSCVVYGMPKSAVQAQVVDQVMDLDGIALAMASYLK
ncbi:MAG TPA: CheB methylesterase domain-containing protein [Bacillaceae bacterium]